MKKCMKLFRVFAYHKAAKIRNFLFRTPTCKTKVSQHVLDHEITLLNLKIQTQTHRDG